MAVRTGEPQVFRYEKPELKSVAGTVWLCTTDIMNGTVRVLKKGEENLHAHPDNEGFWFVLNGRARFYGEGDVLLGDLGRFEGIVIPRGCQYWFEVAGDEPLEILRVGAKDLGAQDARQRVDYTPLTAATLESEHVPATAPARGGAAAVGEPPPGWLR